MALHDAPRFQRSATEPTAEFLAGVLTRHGASFSTRPWLYCGYTALPAASVPPPAIDVDRAVDNMFRLGPLCGFERTGAIVTCGLRTSRFALLLFWEVLHALEPGGIWIDVDETDRTHGSRLIARDFLEREYFAECLRVESRQVSGPYVVTTLRKTLPTAIAAGIDDRGWSFGILTAGPSPRAAQMAHEILALDLPAVEIVFCGPRPDGAPDDPRVRTVDLEQPEPRGWITRKKNLFAAAAAHENLCLLHDRYVVTPAWADALKDYGSCYSFLTFPHVYFAGEGRRFPQRYPDYQVLAQERGLDLARQTHVYDSSQILHPDYDDFSETSYCCGGLYIARRILWNRIPQDEGLFHCEFEDVSFGLECQRRGIPHRVNALIAAESLVPHPMLLTRLHTLRAGHPQVRGHLHVSAEQRTAAAETPHLLHSAVGFDRASYFERVWRRFNDIPGLAPEEKLPRTVVDRAQSASDLWRAIGQHVASQPFTSRERLAELGYFLSDTIFRFATPQLQAWIREHERSLARSSPLARFDMVVGWGTGSAFQAAHRHIGRALEFVVDRDPAKWDGLADGVIVRGPKALRGIDPEKAAVVVFSCYFDEVRAAALAEGAAHVLRAADVVINAPFRPLTDMAGYFSEVERYYPNFFAPVSVKAAA